ncbi:unnamed protein product [Lampetra fluviatilis]
MSGREAAREGQQGGQQQQQRVAVLDAEYGKRGVRVLQLRRDPRGLHVVREVRARLLLSLASLADYERGDNAAVVPTDTLKNTVHALALANGIRCLEEFASQLCEHVMRTHGRVDRVRASLTETPWRRMNLDGKPHNHAFVLSPEVEFYCDVEAQQYGPPLVRSGLRGLRVLKTAQSGFEGFAREGFASLEASRDRLFCTEMEARWAFQRGLPLSARDYDEARERVRACLLEAFAGPPDTGVYSPSVQHTLYLAGQSVLQSLPHVEDIRITMPNLHYTPIDLRKLGLKNNDQVFLPTSSPAGLISATVCRQATAKL